MYLTCLLLFVYRHLCVFVGLLLIVIVYLKTWSNIFPFRLEYATQNLRRYRTSRLTSHPSLTGEPHPHIAYLKVHKTGSSTAQTLFLRYGLDRNLTFVVANNKSWFPNIISLNDTVIPGYNIIPPPHGHHYDILCFHVVYNRSAFEGIMPKDTKYIGIVREPFLQFQSTLRYFNPKTVFGDGRNVSTYLKSPKLFENPKEISFTNNRMAYEFGFPASLFQFYDSLKVEQYLEKLGKEFDFVIINEYMEESIVVLRRILNWNVKDVLFFTKNISIKKPTIDDADLNERKLYHRYAKLDYALYDFFLERFWQQIYIYGQDILKEISYFKSLRRTVEHFCITTPGKGLDVESSPWSAPFRITFEDCRRMLESEFWYYTQIMRRQYH